MLTVLMVLIGVLLRKQSAFGGKQSNFEKIK